ncbi:MAG: hypothetical protein OEV49_00325 [candidate division Zixibacteria bacterium]|nr:hypothetical protein [candidate division Zixibacteria bacterium]MDH4032504.1 hypothetical protein [candidate division Zixibacteria bacterium]
MSTALMDILSCGLAAVIILLIIALSTSESQGEQNLRATLYEVTIHNNHRLVQEANQDVIMTVHGSRTDTVVLDQINATNPAIDYLVPLPQALDSAMSVRVYRPLLHEDHRIRDILVIIAPDALPAERGQLRFEFKITNEHDYTTLAPYYYEARVISDLDQVPETFRFSDSCDGETTLQLIFSAKPNVKVLSGDQVFWRYR